MGQQNQMYYNNNVQGKSQASTSRSNLLGNMNSQGQEQNGMPQGPNGFQGANGAQMGGFNQGMNPQQMNYQGQPFNNNNLYANYNGSK